MKHRHPKEAFDGAKTTRLATRLATRAVASGFALASGLGWPQPAHAREWAAAGDLGVFAAFHFDARRDIQFGVGMEVRGVFIERIDSCFGSPQAMFSGAVARAEVVGWKQTRLTLGPVIGSTNRTWGYGLDATGGIVLGADRGWIGNIGVDGTGFSYPNLRLGFAIGRDATAGAGLRAPPMVAARPVCSPGRPLRRGDGRAPLAGGNTAVVAGRRSSARDDGQRERDELRVRAGRVWMRRACLEWASVPAFCELAAQLEVAGAPHELSSRARDAAADELRHAIVSGQVSGALSGALSVDLDPPVATARPAVSGREALSRLAVESWHDGCLGEGAAAAVARREAEATGSPIIGRVQTGIAADEKRHADLAWDVIEWLLRTDPAVARPLLERAASAALVPRSSDGPDGDGLKRFGLLDAAATSTVVAGSDAEARLRLVARLHA